MVNRIGRVGTLSIGRNLGRLYPPFWLLEHFRKIRRNGVVILDHLLHSSEILRGALVLRALRYGTSKQSERGTNQRHEPEMRSRMRLFSPLRWQGSGKTC